MARSNLNLRKENDGRLLFNSPSTAKNNNKRQNDKYFEIGDYVFAKIKGHSAWPAKISNIVSESVKKRHGQLAIKYGVHFFGTNETGIVTSDALWPYLPNRQRFGMPKALKRFNEAIYEIETEMRNLGQDGVPSSSSSITARNMNSPPAPDTNTAISMMSKNSTDSNRLHANITSLIVFEYNLVQLCSTNSTTWSSSIAGLLSNLLTAACIRHREAVLLRPSLIYCLNRLYNLKVTDAYTASIHDRSDRLVQLIIAHVYAPQSAPTIATASNVHVWRDRFVHASWEQFRKLENVTYRKLYKDLSFYLGDDDDDADAE